MVLEWPYSLVLIFHLVVYPCNHHFCSTTAHSVVVAGIQYNLYHHYCGTLCILFQYVCLHIVTKSGVQCVCLYNVGW
jgi:hypothetical protein